jgi:hypothetical protein
MIIRATKKLFNISGIKPIKSQMDLLDKMPGEWYANIVSMNRPGKFVIHFLHYPTYISILVPGKSLNRVIPFLPDRVSSLLKRNGFSKLESQFQLDSKAEIFATNSRSMLAHMNQIRYNIEFHLALAESVETIDYDNIEDIHLNYMFGTTSKPGKYIKPKKLLDNFTNNNIGTLKLIKGIS